MFRKVVNDEEFELKEFKKKQQREAAANTVKISLAVKFIEAIDLAAIYTMFLDKFLMTFYQEIGKYFMLPITVAASLIQATLAWRQAYLDGGKSRSLVYAVVETAAAAAITTAVVGSLAASAAFALATPILFTATTAAKTLYHAGAAIYYLCKSVAAPQPRKKEKNSERAKQHGIAAAAGVVATAAVTCVILLGKTVVTGLGIAVSFFGAGYALYKGIQAFTEADKPTLPLASQEIKEDQDSDDTPEPSAIHTLYNGLGISTEILHQSIIERQRVLPSTDLIKTETATHHRELGEVLQSDSQCVLQGGGQSLVLS